MSKKKRSAVHENKTQPNPAESSSGHAQNLKPTNQNTVDTKPPQTSQQDIVVSSKESIQSTRIGESGGQINSLPKLEDTKSADEESSVKEGDKSSQVAKAIALEDDDDMSIVEGRMIHTDITETNNPFIEAQSHQNDAKSFAPDLTATQRNQSIQNPNQVYGEDNANIEDDSLVSSVVPQKPSTSKVQTPSYKKKSDFDISATINHPKNTSTNQKAVERSTIQIFEVNKISEGQGRAYVAYSIKFGDSVVRRRYTDFELLRNILVKLFPITLIPPIPKKESIKNYGKAIAGNTGSKFILPPEDMGSADLSNSVIGETVSGSDEALIRHRIHMLTIFLNKVINDPEVSKTSIMSDFLEPNNTNWGDFIASSATFSSLPKNILNCNPVDPTNTSRIYVSLPVPSTTQLIIPKEVRSVSNGSTSKKDPFDVVEQEYKSYESLLSDGIYKHNKKITSSLYGMKNDYRDISAIAVEFENQEDTNVEIRQQLSALGELYSERHVLLETLVSNLHYSVDEPFAQTVGMAGSARDLIRFRKLKSAQNDMIQKSLDSKKKQLTKLVAENSRFGHMDDAITHESGAVSPANGQSRGSSSGSYSGKLFTRFNKIATFVKDSVSYPEVNPSVAISDLKREIEELESFLKVTRPDLEVMTNVIQEQQLPAFQNENSNEVSTILKFQSKHMKAYAEKNLELWKQLKDQQNA